VSAKRKTPGSVSVTELQANAARVLRRVQRGRAITVTHRRKEVARLVPIRPARNVEAGDDSFFHLADLAEPMGVLNNEQIDRLVYGG
jgi:prevent-host-death family protein